MLKYLPIALLTACVADPVFADSHYLEFGFDDAQHSKSTFELEMLENHPDFAVAVIKIRNGETRQIDSPSVVRLENGELSVVISIDPVSNGHPDRPNYTLTPDTYTVTFVSPGYTVYEFTVTIEENDTAEILVYRMGMS